MFSRFFIERPVFAAVLSIIILMAGAVSLKILPIAQYPEIAPPTVNVTAIYPGASAQTMLHPDDRLFQSSIAITACANREGKIDPELACRHLDRGRQRHHIDC